MDISSTDSKVFAEAIESGDVKSARAMIDRYPEIVSHPDWTPPPLHCAVLWNQVEIAKLLLDRGADIESLDPDRQTTPLRFAIMYCQAKMIKLLLSRGAVSGPIKEDGTTALELAHEASNGAFEAFEDLPRPSEYRPIVNLLRNMSS